MESVASDMLTSIITLAVPVFCTIEFGNILISMVARAAFGGRLWIGR